MAMALTHKRMSLNISEDTAHTVEVTREENEKSEPGSFGFTLFSERPAIIQTIVAGGPAERAGLRKNECILTVNGRDVRYCSHIEVVNLIANTPTTSVWLSVCDPPQNNSFTYSNIGIKGGLGSMHSTPIPNGMTNSFTNASVLVLYIGPVEISESWSDRGISSKCIQECTRQLLSQRQEFIEVFLEMTLATMKVLTVSRNCFVKHKRDELYYCGVCTDDEQYFAVVTRKMEAKSSQKLVINPDVDQTVPSDGSKQARASICHVFKVIRNKSVLVLHGGDKKTNPEVKERTIPITSCVTIVNAIKGLFVAESGSSHSLRVGHSNIAFSSVGSSGSGGSIDSVPIYGTASDKSKKKKLESVDLRPVTFNPNNPSAIYDSSPVSKKDYPNPVATPAFHHTGSAGKVWYNTSSLKENVHTRTSSWDYRDSRSRSTSGNYTERFGANVDLNKATKMSDDRIVSSLSSSPTPSLSFQSSLTSRSRSPSPIGNLSLSVSSSGDQSPNPGTTKYWGGFPRSSSPEHTRPVKFTTSASRFLQDLVFESPAFQPSSPMTVISSTKRKQVQPRFGSPASFVSDPGNSCYHLKPLGKQSNRRDLKYRSICTIPSKHTLAVPELLQDHFVTLMQHLNVTQIRPYLHQYKVLTRDEYIQLLQDDFPTSKAVEHLVVLIESKGSQGFRMFVEALERTVDQEPGHKDILEKLKMDSRFSQILTNPVTANPHSTFSVSPSGEVSQSPLPLITDEHIMVMKLLQEAMPEGVRPYKLLGSHTVPDAVICLAFSGNDKLAAGSRDSHIYLWNTADLSLLKKITLSKAAVSLDTCDKYLAVGSDVVQVIDASLQEGNRKIYASDDEPLESLPLHLVAFNPSGHLFTASVEDSVVKVWPPELSFKKVVKPLSNVTFGDEPGCICSLSVSPSCKLPLLAVGIQPSKQFRPVGNKQVYLYNWKTQKLHCTPFDTGCDNQVCTIFSPDGKYLATGCNTNLCIWCTDTVIQLCKIEVSSDAISCLCYSPTGEHLSVGKSNGEVQVYEVNSGIASPIFTLRKPESSSAATSLTYSMDGKRFFVGHENGLLQLWEAYTKSDSHRSHVVASEFKKLTAIDDITFCDKPLITRRGVLEVDISGKEYSSEYDGFKVVIPEGVISKGEWVSLQHGVIPYAPFHGEPFQYPDGICPMSSIVWLCPTPMIQFHKPIEITLQHCAVCASEEDCQSLVFLKADHTDTTTGPNGNKIMQFKPADGEKVFLPNTYNGTLYTNHCCFICVGRYKKEYTDEASYCLITATPHDMVGKGTSYICFCLTYYLDTCCQTVAKQFGESYRLFRKRVTFSDGQDPVVKIKFDRPGRGGWLVSRKGPKKIHAKDLCFWKRFKTTSDLHLACVSCEYPPRFTLEVSAENATETVYMEVEFEGPYEDVSTEVALKCNRQSLAGILAKADNGEFSYEYPVMETHEGSFLNIYTNKQISEEQHSFFPPCPMPFKSGDHTQAELSLPCQSETQVIPEEESQCE